MCRLLALILMLIIPLQFAWSAAANLHGHLSGDVAVLGMHTHDHHHDLSQSDNDASLAAGSEDGHNEDGHHGSHCHPVFSSIIVESGLSLGISPPDGPPPHPLAAFLSHTPPLFDRPPQARA